MRASLCTSAMWRWFLLDSDIGEANQFIDVLEQWQNELYIERPIWIIKLSFGFCKWHVCVLSYQLLLTQSLPIDTPPWSKSFSCWFCREWENHPKDVEMALPLILQKSGRFVPPYIIGISSIRLNWVALTVLIQYDSVPRTQSSSQRFTSLAEERWCVPLLEVTRVSWETKAQTVPGDRRFTPYPDPNDPWIFGWNLEDVLSKILHEIQQWNESISEKKYSSWIHEWEVSIGRLRSITINFWVSHGHPSGFGSRKLIFPPKKRGRKEPSDFESSQNFIIQ